jgi:hypothetical protein
MRRKAIICVALAAGLVLVLGGGLGACFSPEQPTCAFTCSATGLCPDNYVCQADGYCHKNGSTAACPFPDAAASDAAIEMSVPDLTDYDSLSQD